VANTGEGTLARELERRSGVALWRQIADQIRLLAAGAETGGDGRLPPEAVLAARFGVNRHTVRSAIGHLVKEGVLRSEQGRGTFAVRTKRLTYPIATRTRFSAGLEGQAKERMARLLSHAREEADLRVAKALKIAAGAPVVRLETVSEADGRPVSRATSWFDAARFDGIADRFARSGSVTAALKAFGVEDYVRRSTAISARHAGHEELEVLRLSPGAIVLVAEAVNDDLFGRPIHYSLTSFAADRVELRVETADTDRATGRSA
jgi:GntR family transcriptional regulator, phosphonate transport system regulatory protein